MVAPKVTFYTITTINVLTTMNVTVNRVEVEEIVSTPLGVTDVVVPMVTNSTIN